MRSTKAGAHVARPLGEDRHDLFRTEELLKLAAGWLHAAAFTPMHPSQASMSAMYAGISRSYFGRLDLSSRWSSWWSTSRIAALFSDPAFPRAATPAWSGLVSTVDSGRRLAASWVSRASLTRRLRSRACSLFLRA